MALNDTVRHMRELLAGISVDLEKAAGGNKAASQRVRTGTIRLEKIAKHYRKESIASEKSGGGKRHAKKGHAKAKAKGRAKTARVKAHPKAKAVHARRKGHSMSRRATAKIPMKK